jgi:hypothetical protein
MLAARPSTDDGMTKAHVAAPDSFLVGEVGTQDRQREGVRAFAAEPSDYAGSWYPGVDFDSSTSSSVMSAGMASNSGVDM